MQRCCTWQCDLELWGAVGAHVCLTHKSSNCLLADWNQIKRRVQVPSGGMTGLLKRVAPL